MNGVALVTYNRANNLGEIIERILRTTSNCKVVVTDDGSTDETPVIVSKFKEVYYVRGPNKGVAFNKNRALFVLQNCEYIALIEDDLVPIQSGWFEIYKEVAEWAGIHHFCRVQDKQVVESVPSFSESLKDKKNLTAIYGESPRGDLTFITSAVLHKVGALNFKFNGLGFAHGEWSRRIANAGLIPHPLKWIDIQEARDMFLQKGDTEGGRWVMSKAELKQQLKVNKAIERNLKASNYVYEEIDFR